MLRVLLRKHRAIRKALGVSIPVPGDEATVMNAVAENLLLNTDSRIIEPTLPGMEEWLRPRTEQLLLDWDDAANKERASRSLFAQRGISIDEVAVELAAVREAVGRAVDVEDFVRTAVVVHGGVVGAGRRGAVDLDLSEVPMALRDALGGVTKVVGRFELPVRDGETYLSRTHPVVAGLANHVLDAALDPLGDGMARRCGAMCTAAVMSRTVVLVVRHRFHLVTVRAGDESPLVAEDCAVLAFTGAPKHPAWLDDGNIGSYLWSDRATPDQDNAELSNRAVLAGVRGLTSIRDERNGSVVASTTTTLVAKYWGQYGLRVPPRTPPRPG